MAARHIETSRTRLGAQTSSLATAAAALKDLEIITATPPMADAVQKTATNNAQTRRRRDYRAEIKLSRSGSPVKLSAYVKGLSSVLNAAATPVAFTSSSALSHQLLLRAIFGAELTPAAGSTVASSSGTPVDEISVATGHGSRFVPGQIIVIERSAAAPWVRRVTAVSGDDLTISPPLPSGESPSTSAVVRNAYCYFPGESDSQTFTVEHAAVDPSGSVESQVRALGVHGGGSMKLGINEVAEYAFDGQSVSHTAPGDLSVSLDPVADDMGDPMVWQPTLWWGDLATAPSSVAELSVATLGVPRKWQMVPGAVLEGVGSVHEVAGRGDPIGVDCEGLFDSDAWADFASNAEKAFVAYTVIGVGSAARVVGFWCPRVIVQASPTMGAMESLLSRKFRLKALQAQDVAGATPALTTPGIQTANVVWFVA